jgi:hypothetical protein
MPSYLDLDCHVQYAGSNIPFHEHETVYGNRVVETYIAVPDKPTPFNIRLTSSAFIHEGLAAVVFMDGTYQANRNRVNLIPSKKGVPKDRTLINFLLRQKEISRGDCLYYGRDWRFDNHNIGK